MITQEQIDAVVAEVVANFKPKKIIETYKDIVGTIMYPANKFGRVVYESG